MKSEISRVQKTAAVLAATALISASVLASERYKIDTRDGGKLYTTTAKINVLVAPKTGSKIDDTYDAGAIMSVVGEATGTGYLLVNPCRACKNGYVEKTEFLSNAKRP